jgi:hypothetical protein
MQFRPSDSSADSSESLTEDDIDQLFLKLQPLEVPEDVVRQVLVRLKRLPIAQRYLSAKSNQVVSQPLKEPQDVFETPS